MATDFKLVIRNGPHINLRTHSGLSERLDLGNTVPIPIDNYEDLSNLPKINGVTLIGNKTSKQLKIMEPRALTNEEIETIIENVFT